MFLRKKYVRIEKLIFEKLGKTRAVKVTMRKELYAKLVEHYVKQNIIFLLF